MKKIKKIVPFGLSFLPLIALAQTNFNNLTSAFDSVKTIINFYLIPLLVGLAVVYFLYGVLTYVRAGADETKRTEGRNMMIFGIIAIAVMVSVWGLVNFLLGTFNLSNQQAPPLPRV